MLHQYSRNALPAFPLAFPPANFVSTLDSILLQLSVFRRTFRTLLLLNPFPSNTSASVPQYTRGEGSGSCLATRPSFIANAFSKEL
jgi:hypothetical protein